MTKVTVIQKALKHLAAELLAVALVGPNALFREGWRSVELCVL